MAEEKFKDTSDEFLKTMVHNQPSGGYLSAQHKEAIAELERRNKVKDEESKARITTSIRWSKIAAIAAIIGIGLMLLQILLSIYQYRSSQSSDLAQTKSTKQNIQQTNKPHADLSSSLSNSSGPSPSKKSP